MMQQPMSKEIAGCHAVSKQSSGVMAVTGEHLLIPWVFQPQRVDSAQTTGKDAERIEKALN